MTRSTDQAAEYEFPYHYLPHFDRFGAPRVHRVLVWGLEYLSYLGFVVRLVEELAPASLLDVGCGDGRLLYELRDRVPRLVGCDTDERAARFARAFNPTADVHLGDVSGVPGAFDAVVAMEVLEHVTDDALPGLVSALAARVAGNGKLIVSVPTSNLPMPPKHFRHYNLDRLRAQLAPAFEIERHFYVVRDSALFRGLTSLAANRWMIAVPHRLRRLIWRAHAAWTIEASAADGRHLVAVARPRAT
jgi:2-polyprenyl-3-methyl-5-hydroxy-6-metoxy-1,4-benzoquinol methylase